MKAEFTSSYMVEKDRHEVGGVKWNEEHVSATRDGEGLKGGRVTDLDVQRTRRPKRTGYLCPGSSTFRAGNVRDTSRRRTPEILWCT